MKKMQKQIREKTNTLLAMKTIFLSLAMALVTLTILSCNKDSSPWVLKLEGRKITKKQFNAAYDGYLTMGKEQLQMMTGRRVSDQEFKKYVKNPEMLGNAELARVFTTFQKRNFLEQYKVMLLINQEAQKTGFLKNDKIRPRLDYLEKYFIANMFMMDKVGKEAAEISDQEAIKAWEVIKKQDARYRSVPLDQGMEMAKNQIMGQKAKMRQEELVNSLRDQYRIESNSDFDMDKFLSNGGTQGDEKKPEANPQDK